MRTVCVAAPCPRHFSGPLGPESLGWRLGLWRTFGYAIGVGTTQLDNSIPDVANVESALKTAGRRRGPEKMPMAALRLPCRTCVLSASPRLALDIFQARLARKAWAGDLGRSMFCWYAYRPGALGYFSLHPNSSEGRGSKDAIT